MLLPVLLDFAGQCLDIAGVVVVAADAAHAHLVALLQQYPPHFVQRGTTGGSGVLGIQRQHQQAAHTLLLQAGDGVGHGRRAVGHGKGHQRGVGHGFAQVLL